ncbi:MAG: hypothetical protein ACLSFZ_09110 [Frisingicoccus sp.]
MKTVVTGSEMKAIDTYTIQELGIPSLVLMERAALSMVCRMKERIGRTDRILCICGAEIMAVTELRWHSVWTGYPAAIIWPEIRKNGRKKQNKFR